MNSWLMLMYFYAVKKILWIFGDYTFIVHVTIHPETNTGYIVTVTNDLCGLSN
jgi:hypothetical protein